MENIWLQVLAGLLVLVICSLCKIIYAGLKKKVKILDIFASYIPQDDPPLVTESLDRIEHNGQWVYFKGSILRAIVENCSEKTVAVKHTWLAIDQVQPFEERRLVILGHKKNNRFVIYIVNNGSANINNIKISLTGNYDVESGKMFLRDEELANLFSSTVENIRFIIPELKSGEIKQIADFSIDTKLLHEYTCGRDWVYICKKVEYDFCCEKMDKFLASIVWENDHLEVIYCQGGGDDVERYYVEINSNSEFPQKMELPTDFNINSKSSKQIQVVTYVNESSTVKYHFEFEIAGNKKLVSKPSEVSIAVPIYETSHGFYHTLREWLVENEIVNYKYNDSPRLQKRIEYRNPIKKNI